MDVPARHPRPHPLERGVAQRGREARRQHRRAAVLAPGLAPALRDTTLERVRARMPGWDVHALVAEWHAFWHSSGQPRLRSADAAFLGWIERRVPG